MHRRLGAVLLLQTALEVTSTDGPRVIFIENREAEVIDDGQITAFCSGMVTICLRHRLLVKVQSGIKYTCGSSLRPCHTRLVQFF